MIPFTALTLKLLFMTFTTQHWHSIHQRFPQSLTATSLNIFNIEMLLNEESFKYFLLSKSDV